MLMQWIPPVGVLTGHGLPEVLPSLLHQLMAKLSSSGHPDHGIQSVRCLRETQPILVAELRGLAALQPFDLAPRAQIPNKIQTPMEFGRLGFPW